MKLRTCVRNEETKRKQLRLTESVWEWLKSTSNDACRPVSQGLLLYEMIQQVEDIESDIYTEKENRVNQEFSATFDRSLLCVVDSVKVRLEDGHYPSQGRIDREDDLTESLKNIYLPVRFVEALEEDWGRRYWNEHISDVVTDYIDSAYDSRYDRLRCKAELIEWKRTGEEPNHRVALSIVRGDTDRFGVDKANRILEADKWWFRPDLDYDDVITGIDDKVDESTSIDAKISIAHKMLVCYAKEREMDMPRKLAINLISKHFGISESYVENEYLPEIDIPDYSEDEDDEEHIDYYERCKQAKEKLIDYLKERGEKKLKNKIKRMNAPNVCLVRKEDIEKIDDMDKREERDEKIAEVVERGRIDKYYKSKQQNSLNRELMDNLRKELE